MRFATKCRPTVALTTLVVFAVVVRVSVATEKLFFKDNSDGGETSIHAALGESVVLNCEAGGSSSPTIHWLHQGRRIQQVRVLVPRNIFPSTMSFV